MAFISFGDFSPKIASRSSFPKRSQLNRWIVALQKPMIESFILQMASYDLALIDNDAQY